MISSCEVEVTMCPLTSGSVDMVSRALWRIGPCECMKMLGLFCGPGFDLQGNIFFMDLITVNMSGCPFADIWTSERIFLGSGNAHLNLLYAFPYQSINTGIFLQAKCTPSWARVVFRCMCLVVFVWSFSDHSLGLSRVLLESKMFGYWTFLEK